MNAFALVIPGTYPQSAIMNKAFSLLILLVVSVNCSAQLSVKDLNSFLNGLKRPIDKPDSALITAMDSLQAKGEVFYNLDKSGPVIASFQNLADTVRKEFVEISSTSKTNEIDFSIKVITRDIAVYNGWRSSVASDPKYVIDRSANIYYDHRVYKTLMKAPENRQFDFSVSRQQDPKTFKYYFLYQVIYTRQYNTP